MNTSTSGRELVISRLIHAPRERVWEAWTDPEHIRHWWGPEGFTNSIHKMEVRPGGEWEFVMHGPDGTDYKNKHIYTELEKPSRIVMRHVSFPSLVLTATFEAKGQKTLVTLHSVFESAEQLQEVIRVFKADTGMQQNMARMENYITRLQLLQHPPVVVERLFPVPVNRLWQALTDPEQMREWYFDLPDFRPEPGTNFRFAGTGSSGEQYMHSCEVQEVIPGKKLSYSWTYEHLDGYSLVTFELHPEAAGTRLRVTHEGLHSFSGNGADFQETSFQNGWTELIGNRLAQFLNNDK